MEFTAGLVVALLYFSTKKTSVESFSFQFYVVYDKAWTAPCIRIVKHLYHFNFMFPKASYIFKLVWTDETIAIIQVCPQGLRWKIIILALQI